MGEHESWEHMRKHLRSMAETIDGAVRKVSPFGSGKARPLADVCETDREVVVRAEVAGVPRDNLSVTLKAGVLTIAGKEPRTDVACCRCLTNERGPAEFSREIVLPSSADPDAEPTATLADGLLTVRLPKGPVTHARTIRVDVQ
ncbi:MAG: Hsp20/alpha crystallin family protein [Candidatus Brocadiaceae bacterium]|nr:Hsp20/alpha crystallin family protein [Candidatus Brocadiaceae bacterium]